MLVGILITMNTGDAHYDHGLLVYCKCTQYIVKSLNTYISMEMIKKDDDDKVIIVTIY